MSSGTQMSTPGSGNSASPSRAICPHCGKVSADESPRFCSGYGERMDGCVTDGFPGCPAPQQKNATIAGFCSSFLPGLGQVYNGEAAKGFTFFILTLAGLFIFLIPGLFTWLYAVYDAYAVATRMNTGKIPFRETRALHMVLFIVFAVIVIVAALLIVIAMVITSLMGQTGMTSAADFNRMLGNTGGF